MDAQCDELHDQARRSNVDRRKYCQLLSSLSRSGASPGQNMWGGQIGEHGALAYNGGLEAERPPPTPPPVKLVGFVSISGASSSKSGVDNSTCPPQSTPWRRHWSRWAFTFVEAS